MSAPHSWIELPLDGDGRSLVEASAGTGKTWTIAALYLRLLLERKLSPRQIIVSTFTKAAAAELSERLRGKLLWALAEADKHANGEGAEASEEESQHSDLHWLRQRWRQQPGCLSTDIQRLQSALSEFDAAPISTLHGLCSRILSEHPFAAGALFRGREIIDAKSLQRALADDLWRVIAQGEAQLELVMLAKAAEIGRNQIDRYLPVLLQPGVVVAARTAFDLHAHLGHLDFLQDVPAWADSVERLADLHTTARARLRRAWPALAQALRTPSADLSDLLEHLSDLDKVEAMTGVNKAGKTDPEVLRLVEQTRQIVDALPPLQLDLAASPELRRFLAAAQDWCQAAMQARLDAANQSTFDQLLTAVGAALQPREGQRALADALFEAWPVALVDEFQDTDPVQFGILDAIYRDAGGAPRGRLVMIGDPKQAIYRFRGGDVQAYERAKDGVAEEDRLSLDTNFRSSRGYVEAVNQFYAATGTRLGPPSSATRIAYEAVQCGGKADQTPLIDAESDSPIARPLVLHALAADAAFDDLEAHALRCCAGQIVQLLSEHGYRIGEKRLQPGDVAVLLPTNKQVGKLAGLLKARGVPCVTGSQASVFDSDTARELRLVLHAALHAEDPRAQRAAVATRLWGGSLRELQRLRHDPVASDAEAGSFHALHAVLEKSGPLGVVTRLLEQQATRLLETREGERMLTDLRHLGELLQEAWQDCGSGERLMGWFADQVEDGAEAADASDARALRLESDAARVQLMTLHASKGLEFGVVLMPLMWKHKGHGGKGPALLGDPDTHMKYLVEGPAKDSVKQQELEERFRILYVALTRAIHACHVFLLSPQAIAKEKQARDAPLNRLPLDTLRASAAESASCIALIQGWAEHAGLHHRRDGDGSQTREARALPTPPRGPLPMRHSFSTLSGGGRRRVAEEDAAADDEALEAAIDSAAEASVEDTEAAPAAPAAPAAAPAPAPEPSFHAGLDALATVAGTDFGNAVHALFEHRVPGQPVTAAQALAALREHGVRPRKGELDEVAEALAERINRVLKTPLAEPEGPRLWDLTADDMRAELEFNYALDGASLRALRAACEQNGEPGLVPAREQTLAGLMNGKIDLVFAHGGRFHVLDYKGNQLARGARASVEDYAPEALEPKMLSSGYRLQALLYTVAVERYLRERLGAAYRRDRHLGDCWYLFVRAVGLVLPDGRPCGVWRHRFGDALLDAVQAVLSTRQEEAA